MTKTSMTIMYKKKGSRNKSRVLGRNNGIVKRSSESVFLVERLGRGVAYYCLEMIRKPLNVIKKKEKASLKELVVRMEGMCRNGNIDIPVTAIARWPF